MGVALGLGGEGFEERRARLGAAQGGGAGMAVAG
jgi:hypothetical protein